MKKKQITIVGSVWDFWPILKLFDRNFDSKFVSIYEPWLKGEIDKKKIIKFEEKNSILLLAPIKIIRRTAKIISLIKNEKPELVISHHDESNITMLPTILLNKVFKFTNTRFIFWVRNNPIETYKKGAWSKIVLFSYKYLYKHADKIVVQTEQNKENIAKNFKCLKNKLAVFANVYNIKKNQSLAKEKLDKKYENVFKENFVFYNLGRTTLQKGQWSLIRAFKRVNEQNPKTRLVITGIPGELDLNLRKMVINLDLKDRVFFTGKQKNPFKFMKNSSCLVLSSLWEGMPNTILESLSVNLPVISTDCISGPREILEPKLGINEKIKYPYYGRYGVLIPVFDREIILDSIEVSPLNKKEQILFEEMLKISKEKKLLRKYSKGINRAKDFDIGKMSKSLKQLN